MKEPLTLSVVIPAKNEADNITACLEAVLNQETPYQLDVLVIDSGSSDDTLNLVKKFPGVAIHEIPAESFGHGSTRNLGAELTSGSYIVFLNADAIPADKNWLNPLIAILKNNPDIAGVFSRHLPKPGCHLYMARDLLTSMPDKAKTTDRAGVMDFMLFSTVSCAIPRKIWETYRLNPDILIAEDQEWAERVLKAGYRIAYEPASRVLHSHNFTTEELYRIKRRISLSVPKFKSVFSARLLGFIWATAGAKLKWFGDILFIIGLPSSKMSFSGKWKEIAIALKARVAGFRGRYAGWLEAAKRLKLGRAEVKKS